MKQRENFGVHGSNNSAVNLKVFTRGSTGDTPVRGVTDTPGGGCGSGGSRAGENGKLRGRVSGSGSSGSGEGREDGEGDGVSVGVTPLIDKSEVRSVWSGA